MNQAILFSDNEKYNAHLQQLEFQAQHQGKLISCIISINGLLSLSESDDFVLTEERVLALFDAVRFDIEELAEKLIYKESFHSDGKVYLTDIL